MEYLKKKDLSLCNHLSLFDGRVGLVGKISDSQSRIVGLSATGVIIMFPDMTLESTY
jgi:hypothetical protein